MTEKLERYWKALRIATSQVRSIARDHNYLDWYYLHKKSGIPLESKSDKDYIDWHYRYKGKLEQFRDIHQGEDCFIIGNGPSIAKMDLSVLNGYNVFGLNKIFLLFEKTPLDLSYLVSVNPLVIEQSVEEFNSLIKCPTFLSYGASKGVLDDAKHVYKLLTTGIWSFYKDITGPMTEGFTVTYVAMQIAFFMGFKRVFLIGVDHNFQQKGRPNEQQVYDGNDQNHFHPDYFKGKSWHLADLEGNEASYALARHQFHTAGREIYDATVNGKLTIFPKISFDEALKIANKRMIIKKSKVS